MSRYFTTPIYYVNDRPHIGHLYTTLVTDTLTRFHRLQGEDVRFLTGTDEHGQKIEKVAKREGVAPIDVADRHAPTFRDLWKGSASPTTTSSGRQSLATGSASPS